MIKKIQIISQKCLLTILFLSLGLFLVFSIAKAHVNYFESWETRYPNSSTKDASCELCHGGKTETLNAYGHDICVIDDDEISDRLAAVESLDSDGDGTSNLIEIMTNAQPGWTEGDNRLYHSRTCIDALVNIYVPPSVPGPFDPEFNFFIFIPLITKPNP